MTPRILPPAAVCAAGFLLLAVGCGTVDTRRTVEQLTQARIAVEAAEKADAKTHAPDHLRRAQDALAIAKDAYANQAFTRSFDFAKKATIVARVAKARTEQRIAETRLSEVRGRYEKVRAQTEAAMQTSPQVPEPAPTGAITPIAAPTATTTATPAAAPSEPATTATPIPAENGVQPVETQP